MITHIARQGLAVEELKRLEECAREPIRTPGTIQPHGALMALDPLDYRVEVASDNCASLLGSASAVLGRTLVDVTGDAFDRDLRGLVSAPEVEMNPLRLTVGSRSFDALVHLADGLIVVELEPVLSWPSRASTSALYTLIHQIARSSDVTALRGATALGLRELTGFDRVLIYHFHPDGHGEVIAEACAAEMEPYLGLHFPASDIPAQARELYLTKLSRAIVGTSGASVELLALDGDRRPSVLDLSRAELRSVSPHHLQFMRNMGQESTLSFSMVRDGELVGMITCAHRSELRLPFLMRRGIEVLANQVALQLSVLDQKERLSRQATIRKTRAVMMTQIAASDDTAYSLVHGSVSVRDLIESDGVAVCLGGRTESTGDVPPAAALEALHTFAAATPSAEPFVSNALARDHSGLAALVPSVTGVLLVLLGGTGDYIAFFRNEVLRKVNWLGDQTSANRETALSPRTSFSSWSNSVSGTAEPWGELEAEATELARVLEGALLRKVESELVYLANHDALTGLPNRRRLMEQLELALRMDDAKAYLSLLFIDLDDFKMINDSFGHEVGDALITLVGQRILSATRADDTVARLGGDEFVVLCHDTGSEEAHAVAERVRAAIGEPAIVDGATFSITASVGAAVTGREITASELLRRADVEMYSAKPARKRMLL